MEDLQILREFKINVQNVFPDAEIYLYGSRGETHPREDSDYDVLVLLKEVTPVIRKAIYDIAWELGFKYDALIAPVLSLKDDFHTSPTSSILINVKRSGVLI